MNCESIQTAGHVTMGKKLILRQGDLGKRQSLGHLS